MTLSMKAPGSSPDIGDKHRASSLACRRSSVSIAVAVRRHRGLGRPQGVAGIGTARAVRLGAAGRRFSAMASQPAALDYPSVSAASSEGTRALSRANGSLGRSPDTVTMRPTRVNT